MPRPTARYPKRHCYQCPIGYVVALAYAPPHRTIPEETLLSMSYRLCCSPRLCPASPHRSLPGSAIPNPTPPHSKRNCCQFPIDYCVVHTPPCLTPLFHAAPSRYLFSPTVHTMNQNNNPKPQAPSSKKNHVNMFQNVYISLSFIAM